MGYSELDLYLLISDRPCLYPVGQHVFANYTKCVLVVGQGGDVSKVCHQMLVVDETSQVKTAVQAWTNARFNEKAVEPKPNVSNGGLCTMFDILNF